jgi:hypothetical protein
MAIPLPNRILREIVDIQCFGECESLIARSEVDRLCGERLTGALDHLLTAWGVPDDQLISIDRLHVEVTALSGRDLESHFIPLIIDALRKELTNRVGAPGCFKAGASRPLRQSILHQLRFFLERGYLPWSTRGGAEWITATNELRAQLDAVEKQGLMETLQLPQARLRMVRHFPEATLVHVVPFLAAGDEMESLRRDIERIVRQMRSGADLRLRKEHWIYLLLESAIAAEVPDDVQAELESLIQHSIAEQTVPLIVFEEASSGTVQRIARSVRHESGIRELRSPATDRRGVKMPLRRGLPTAANRNSKTHAKNSKGEELGNRNPIYVANGGLVIAAPYLPALFQKLGLIEDGQVRDVATAMLILHYLVFGSDECAEWDFVLGKILCGIALEHPVETAGPLSHSQKVEVNLLLEAIITNWPALKNTSPAALRATFLQREGTLTREYDYWRLRLTRTAFDVLVDRLPWTISMIQLPWMPWLLRTDWAD